MKNPIAGSEKIRVGSFCSANCSQLPRSSFKTQLNVQTNVSAVAVTEILFLVSKFFVSAPYSVTRGEIFFPRIGDPVRTIIKYDPRWKKGSRCRECKNIGESV